MGTSGIHEMVSIPRIITVVAGVFLVVAADHAVSTRGGAEAQAASQIIGQLLDEETFTPLAGRVVSARVRQRDGATILSTVRVGPDGGFALSGLDDGWVTLVGSAENHGRAIEFVLVNGTSAAAIQLLLPRAISVEGSVVGRTGAPLGGVEVRIEYQEPLHGTVRPEVDEDLVVPEGNWHRGVSLTREESEPMAPGMFRILDIDPGRPFRIVLEHPELASVRSAELIAQPGASLTGLEFVLR